MRVLLLTDAEHNSFDTIEITNIGYTAPDDDQPGLLMFDTDGDTLQIDNVSPDQANEICEEIVKTGYADLREYGEYYYTDA